MACFNPILAVDNGLDKETGKHSIKFVGFKHPEWDLAQFRSFYGDKLMMLPCGRCVACAEDYARTWQARIMCEAEYHVKNCFVTLTYKENPPAKPLKRHLRGFIDRVRKKYGKGIKFFGCGEKGDLNGRSHYHIILFGVDFNEDAEPIQRSYEDYLYRSRSLDFLWTRGFASFGSLSIKSAGYVARYCDKKKLDGVTGESFVIMSRGLGKKYFKDHLKDIFDSDYLYFNGNKFKIPRYFLKLVAGEDFYYLACAEDYKTRKREIAQGFRYNSNKSLGIEENSMKDLEEINYRKHIQKEAFRDV